MPQPGHVTALREADESTLPEDLRPYFQKCRDKLGFVPNVLRAWLLRPERLRTFIRAVIATVQAHGRVGMSATEAGALAGLRAFNYERIYVRPASVAQ